MRLSLVQYKERYGWKMAIWSMTFKYSCNTSFMSYPNLFEYTLLSSELPFINFIGVSLSEPHIDRDNGHHVWNNTIYLSVYVSFTPRWLHPGS